MIVCPRCIVKMVPTYDGHACSVCGEQFPQVPGSKTGHEPKPRVLFRRVSWFIVVLMLVWLGTDIARQNWVQIMVDLAIIAVNLFSVWIN